MPSFTHAIAVSAPVLRSAAIAALLGAMMLAGPLGAARADTASNRTIQLAQATTSPQHHAANAVTEPRTETVEQRITKLHAALQITPAEDSKWNAVAQAMRGNAAAMDALVAQTRDTASRNMTAIDDLRSYQKFAQAHVDGLKSLTESFATLYDSMPDAQKKIADQVFGSSGRQGALSHGQQG